MLGFEYPKKPHTRRHGPEGYCDYESYRDWLRDEFTFRCVYCLHREQWYGRGAAFNIDHLVPLSEHPQASCEYTNLLYACATCNLAKHDIRGIPDPCLVAFGDCLRVRQNGEVEALNEHGMKLREILRLNKKSNVRGRSKMMRLLAHLKSTNIELYQEFRDFPPIFQT